MQYLRRAEEEYRVEVKFPGKRWAPIGEQDRDDDPRYPQIAIDDKPRRVSCPYTCDRLCGRTCAGEIRHSARCDCLQRCNEEPGPFDHLVVVEATRLGAIPAELLLHDTEEMPLLDPDSFDAPEEKTR